MRVLATVFISGLLAVAISAQSTKPKASAPKLKPPETKNKETAAKKPTRSKVQTTASKNNPIAPNPTAASPKIKPVAAKTKLKPLKPKPDESAQNEADEEAEYEKAATVVDGAERIAALRKFIRTYPKAKRVADASARIVTVAAQLGNDKLTAGDIAGAVEYYRSAIADAPKPVPDQLFSETLAKFPANLYFRGARVEGFELAKASEDKSGASVSQLISIATFYMSVENGSEARRVADLALKLDPASAAAYQTLGLASRMDFLLEDSAIAYAKALELEPESSTARRGLAEMKRAFGKSDEAVELYRQILAKDEADLPARTGLVLALF